MLVQCSFIMAGIFFMPMLKLGTDESNNGNLWHKKEKNAVYGDIYKFDIQAWHKQDLND